MSKTAKKITIGVEKAYYATLTADGEKPTYGEVKYLPGLREISIIPKEEIAEIYAENRLYDSENSLEKVDATFDFASISTEDYAVIFGKKIANEGGIIENSNDQAPYIAIMVEKTLSGGVKEYLTLYKGKLGIPEDKAKTKEGKPEYQTVSLKGVFIPLESGLWKYIVKTTDVGFNKDTHAKKWGKEVIIPTAKISERRESK